MKFEAQNKHEAQFPSNSTTKKSHKKLILTYGGSKKIFNKDLFYIKVHTATRWAIRHGLMLLWFSDLTEEVYNS